MCETNGPVSVPEVDERASWMVRRSSTVSGPESAPVARQYSSAVTPSGTSAFPRADVPRPGELTTGRAGGVVARIGGEVVAE